MKRENPRYKVAPSRTTLGMYDVINTHKAKAECVRVTEDYANAKCTELNGKRRG